jgi:hypothetical protein
MNYLKLKKLISHFGSDSQKERVAAGISIPDAEIDDLVYRSIWNGPFFGWYKRKRLSEEEVRQIAVMHRMADPEDPVSFEVVEPADELTEQQWTALKAIQQIGKTVEAQITPFWVIGHCGRKQLKKAYARVEFNLDERPYRIELCLELPNHPKALDRALEMAAKK